MSEHGSPTLTNDAWQYKTCDQVPRWARVTVAGVIAGVLLVIGFIAGVVVTHTSQPTAAPLQRLPAPQQETFLAQPAAQSGNDRADGGLGEQLTVAGARVTVTEVAHSSQFESLTAGGGRQTQYPGQGNKFITVTADLEHLDPSPQRVGCTFAIWSELVDRQGRIHQHPDRLCRIVDGPECPEKPAHEYGSLMMWAFEVPEDVAPQYLKFAKPTGMTGSYTLVDLGN